MTLRSDAEEYARFLVADRAIPMHIGIWLGAFMLMAQRYEFYTKPSIWVPKDGDANVLARVYFVPWSQNKLPALRGLHGRFYFCAIKRDVFLTDGVRTAEIFACVLQRTQFSGAQTRAAFENGKEGFLWLKDQLGAAS